MSDIIVKGVTGKSLLRKPNGENDFWRIEQIYQGEDAVYIGVNDGNRIPNVGDIVIDTTAGYPRWLEVIFIDEITLIPTMQELVTPARNEFSKENVLLGTGPGYQSELWRLFLDQSVIPHVFLPDSRLMIKGKEHTKYKIFLGTDVSSITGKVISMDFNANGELISEDIPLEKVAFASTDTVDTNLAVKVPRKGFTTHSLDNGELVTLVTYSDEGVASSYNTLLVHNTALDRSIESSQKYVTTIGIDSPFLDKTENNTLVFPMNMPRDALAMMGVISYSDGTSKRIPIDGKRLVLSGLDNYVPMKENQNINLVLIYNLPEGEMALNSSVGSQRFIANKYWGRTTPVDGSYSVNLFPIPTYVSATYGWKLRWMLYTLDRDVVYDVTNVVQGGANTTPFNPLSYNETQDITVSVDLQKVDPTLKRFIHVQSVKVALMGEPGPGTNTAWYITYEKDQDPTYGSNVICRAVRDPALNKWRLDLTCGAKTEADWLDRLYYRIKPLTDRYSETRPPKPTHFTLIINDTKVTYPLRVWNQTLEFAVGAYDGYGVIIQWTRVDGNQQYQLGSSPLCFIDISESGTVDHGGTTVVKPDDVVNEGTESTIIDIDAEVRKIIDRGASSAVVEKYRELLNSIKRYGLLRYEDINALYQRIRNNDVTPAQIANDVILLEMEVNQVMITDFNRETNTNGIAPPSMESQR